MDITKLAAKPQLIKITIDDADTLAKYGESVEFYIHDRQDIPTFARMAALDPQNFGEAAELVGTMIRDANGNTVLKDGQILPTDVMMKAIAQVIETLGKLVTVTSEKTTEEQKS